MDEQLYLMGLGMSLEEKIEKAISTFRHYEPEALKFDPVNGYYLCDSYGKDSGVILHLAQRSGVRFTAHHSLTTLDPPELIMHGRKHHPDTIIHRPKMAMLTRFANSSKGPPTRLQRWCCKEYKEQGGKGMVKVFGIRAQESNRRKANWKVWQPDRTGSWVLNPVLYWSEEDVWQYTRKHNIPYCCLYDQGWKRLGCIGCPMAGREGQLKDFARWLGYERAWKHAFERFWNNWHGVPLERERWVSMEGKWPFSPLPGERIESRFLEKANRIVKGFYTSRRWFDLRCFESWQDLWSWWMEEMPGIDDPDDCQMGLF